MPHVLPFAPAGPHKESISGRVVEAEPSLLGDIRRALRALELPSRRATLVRGRVLALEAADSAAVHLLLEGRVKRIRYTGDGRALLLDVLTAGEIFGEESLSAVTGSEAVYAEAVDVVEIESVARDAFERMLEASPGLALRIARLVSERRSELERRLEEQVFERAEVRLARQLQRLASRFGVATNAGTLVDVPLSQQDLGNLIGASREVVSLTLSEFRRRRLVVMAGRRIVLTERFSLARRPGKDPTVS